MTLGELYADIGELLEVASEHTPVGTVIFTSAGRVFIEKPFFFKPHQIASNNVVQEQGSELTTLALEVIEG